MNEYDRALMEGHEIAASNAYFSARPQIDTNDRRKVFEAGFKAAWNAVTENAREHAEKRRHGLKRRQAT